MFNKTDLYLQNSKSQNTCKAYNSDLSSYTNFCNRDGIRQDTEDSIVRYITWLADDHKIATIHRHLVSISQHLVSNNIPDYTKSPLCTTLIKGIKRSKDNIVTKAKPLLIDDIQKIVNLLDITQLPNLRNKVIMLLGFAMGGRRSELANLQLSDIEITSEGVLVNIRKSKTDQDSKGYMKAIPFGKDKSTCPVSSLISWIEKSNITTGYLFRKISHYGKIGASLTPDAIGKIIKQITTDAGLIGSYSGHSLRSGLITECAMAGLQEYEIMQQTGHRSAVVLRGYIQQANLFKSNAINKIGI